MGNQSAGHCSLSQDGAVVAYESQANNLLPGVTNGGQHVYRVGPLF